MCRGSEHGGDTVPCFSDSCTYPTESVWCCRLLDVIKETTMVGLLPVPHQILVRKYVENANMNKWFTAYIWGTIYMRNQSPPLFDSEKISLFTIFYKPANVPE